MSMTEQKFREMALDDPEGHWELHCGEPRRKPVMTMEHNDVQFELAVLLHQQLDPGQFRVRSNAGHVRISSENYYIPDVFVIPMALREPLRGTRELETYEGPLPLVVEVWSRSTGTYDVEVKLREYRRRGHVEIWRIHPYDRTLTAWRRQLYGSYAESVFTGGIVQPIALSRVDVDLDALFDRVG
jgi:Uma2 family endonuclease